MCRMTGVLVSAVLVWASASAWASDPFQLIITNSPAGSVPQPNWGGVLRYEVAGSGGAITPLTGIPAAQVNDPAGLVLRDNNELLVGNRHGNAAPSSVSRFNFDGNSFTPNGTITGNSLFGVHDLAINPVSGELFAANVQSGASRFTIDGLGNASPNGVIGSGTKRGAAVNPAGDRLYLTSASNTLETFDLITGTSMGSQVLPGTSSLHSTGWGPDGDLYVADIAANGVLRIAFDSNGLPVVKSVITGASRPVDVAFSPDGLEMYAVGHETGLINRFAYQPGTDSWSFTSSYDTGVHLGAIVTYTPEPASAMLLLAGYGWLVSRRRKAC